MKNYNLYVEKKEKFQKEIEKNYLMPGKCTVEEVENGFILPPKKIIDNNKNGIYAGGVADSKGEFVAGLIRKYNDKNFNISCYRSYKVDAKKVKYVDEEVIFGGILNSMFGHTLIEGFTRLWYVLKNKDDQRKIVFLKINSKGSDFGFLKLLGLEDRIIIVEEPIRYRKIIVPCESFYAYTGYYKEWLDIYKAIAENIPAKNYDKVYLTRTKLAKKDCINEEYFETFYKNLGYEIIAPEQHSLEEQIAILKGAKEVATTVGTVSHMVLFCQDNIKLTILNRTVEDVITPQFIIEQAKNIQVNLIDISMNIFPTTHRYGGIFLFMPNDNWKKYITDNHYEKYNNIPLEKEKIFYEYMLAWGRLYYLKDKYKHIYKKDLYDILNNINKYLLKEKTRSRKELYAEDISKEQLLKLYNKNKTIKIKHQIKNVMIKLHMWDFYQKIKKRK